MKEFFVHLNREPGKAKVSGRQRRGFTALIQPDPQNEKNVLFAVTYCSARDQFSKKEGRSSVRGLIPTSVNKRDIPKLLLSAEAICWGGHAPALVTEYSYFYVYRYML